jgi:hypothetical protein
MLDLDAAAVITAAVARRDLFPTADGDATKLARTLMVKAIKAGAAKPATVRAIRDAIGAEAFAHVVDGLTVAEAKAIVGKLDKHNAAAKAADATTQRRRLVEIAAGAEPEAAPAKPAKAPRAPKVAKPKAERGFSSKAALATRQKD